MNLFNKHVRRVTRFGTYFGLCFVLLGCFPTITKVFHTPSVAGRVLDVNTMQPAINASVFFSEHPDYKTTTNREGEFSLVALSSTEAVIKMPAHALKQYPLTVQSNDIQDRFFVTSSLRMYRIEERNLDSLFIDSQPNIPPTNHRVFLLSDHDINSSFNSPSEFGGCSIVLLKNAKRSLYVARKLFNQLHNQSTTLTQTNNSQTLALWLQNTYQHAILNWQMIAQDCPRTTENFRQRDAMIDSIEKESREALSYLNKALL